MTTFTIHVNMDKKCSRCHKRGALDSGICMACMTKGIKRGDYDDILRAKAKAKK